MTEKVYAIMENRGHHPTRATRSRTSVALRAVTPRGSDRTEAFGRQDRVIVETLSAHDRRSFRDHENERLVPRPIAPVSHQEP